MPPRLNRVQPTKIMTSQEELESQLRSQPGALVAPGFVTFTDVTPKGALEQEYVISNEATGKFFLANRATVQFFVHLKESGSVKQAFASAGIPAQRGEDLVKRLVQAGLLVRPGQTLSEADKKTAPLESKLISLRWDFIDASGLTDRLGWVGRILYSPLGYLCWVGIIFAAINALLENSEKLVLSMRQLFDADWRQLLIFGALYVGLKVVHEMGHALAYKSMCEQEDLEPGPIRMGISIFAFTPFPFTDVTGAWRLRSVARRVMIGAGGIYFETWIIAGLTLIWAQTQAGMLQTIILQVAVVAGILALLFNLNPAIKLDGYYMLTDYLRRPNLSGRASLAARNVGARILGAQTPEIIRSDFAYWLLSYVYRWTIFVGIFWLVYQFDARLAPVAALVVTMTLIVRPGINTFKYAYKLGLRPVKVVVFLTASVFLLGVSLIPFPDRILIPGQLRQYETQFLYAPEAGKLEKQADGSFVLSNPEVTQQIKDINLRREMLENLQRANLSSASEKAQLAAEIESFHQSSEKLDARNAALKFNIQSSGIWTPLAAETHSGAWIDPSAQGILGAHSTPAPAYLQLRLDQALLERDLPLNTSTVLRVRAVHDPACEFSARPLDALTGSIAVAGNLVVRAGPEDAENSCVAGLKNGGAVVARLETTSRSLLRRLQLGGSRLLQDRLPLNMN